MSVRYRTAAALHRCKTDLVLGLAGGQYLDPRDLLRCPRRSTLKAKDSRHELNVFHETSSVHVG
jgi:hypothetical protein